jgi:hypothetical protein
VLTEKAAKFGTPLTPDEAVALQGLPAGTRAATDTLLALPADTARHVLVAIDPAYLGGYHAAMLFAAGLALAAAVATLALVRRPDGRG